MDLEEEERFGDVAAVRRFVALKSTSRAKPSTAPVKRRRESPMQVQTGHSMQIMQFSFAARVEGRKNGAGEDETSISGGVKPNLRDELLALVYPEKADPRCAIFWHARRKRVSMEAAEHAGVVADNEEKMATGRSTNNQDSAALKMMSPIGVEESSALSRRLDDGGICDLFRAVERGDLSTVARLLSRAVRKSGAPSSVTRSRDVRSSTCLHAAARWGHEDVCRLLLAHGAECGIDMDTDEQPLHLAAYGGHVEVVEVLLLVGNADPNARSEYGETPLFFAARKGHANIARMLILRGAKPERKDRFGEVATDQATTQAVRDAITTANRAAKAHAAAYDGQTPTWACLPQRALLVMFQFLDPKSVCQAAASSVGWHLAASNDLIARHPLYNPIDKEQANIIKPLFAKGTRPISSSSAFLHRSFHGNGEDTVRPATPNAVSYSAHSARKSSSIVTCVSSTNLFPF